MSIHEKFDGESGFGNEEFDRIMSEAEARLWQGIESVKSWGGRAAKILEDRPELALVGVAALGFATGLLLRRSESEVEEHRF